VTKSISQLKDKLEGFCTEEVEKLSNGGKVPAAAHSFTLKNKSGIMKHVEESKITKYIVFMEIAIMSVYFHSNMH